MGIVNKMKKFFFDEKSRFFYLNKLGFYKSMDDAEYLKKFYRYTLGKELCLENPQTFNEKLQWLKLYDRKPEYTKMVDKYEAKRYVANIVGEEYIIPTLGVWDKFDDIDFDKLPNQFVLKCTHDSGGLVICRDKAKLDIKAARKKINKSLKRDFYYLAREWPYKNVKPRIIAEQYMEDAKTSELRDYKFFCFDGEPKFLYVSSGLENHETARISFLTMDWNFAPYERWDYLPFSELPTRPSRFDEMIEICKKLSLGHSFLRVDLYEINDEVYFSELTFAPCAGFVPFKDPSHDLEIGKQLTLPK